MAIKAQSKLEESPPSRRAAVAMAPVMPAAERRAKIESEPLPRNMADFIHTVSTDGGEGLAWHFLATDERMRYVDLEPAVMRVAAGLASIGIGKGVHVAVMLPNIAAMPLTWLALGVLGAVMVPVNNGYSQREVDYVVGNSEATYIVTNSDCLSVVEAVIADGKTQLPSQNVVLVAETVVAPYHSFEALRQTDATGFVPPEVDHDDLLNIQYTSGTTGFPKGCMLTQRYWLNAGKVNAFRDGRVYKRIFASTPFYYMDPQWLMLMAFHHRGTLFVEMRQSASKFISWIRQHEIEFCLLPVLTLKQPPDPEDRNNKIIRANIYGVSPHLHSQVEERFDLCARECFGMTELGPTLYVPVEATEMIGSGSCGIPCPFRECRIADENGNTLPDGEIGEMLVRGPGILKGYYNNPEATAKAFHGDWFRTGDLFRRDERGYFYIVGRLKDTIRRSGENIAAREVESVLMSCDLVEEAAAIPIKDETRGEEIKAILVWREGVAGSAADIDAVIAHCHANLAPFKVPRYFESRTSIPRTGSFKIAKHVLISQEKLQDHTVFDRRTGEVIHIPRVEGADNV